MLHRIFECIVWLMAAYGLFTLFFGAFNLMRCRIPGHHPKVGVVLLVKDAEEQIEYIARNAAKRDFAAKVLSDNKIAVIDMNSTDGTVQILEKLQKNFMNIEVLKFEDRQNIFEAFLK